MPLAVDQLLEKKKIKLTKQQVRKVQNERDKQTRLEAKYTKQLHDADYKKKQLLVFLAYLNKTTEAQDRVAHIHEGLRYFKVALSFLPLVNVWPLT